MLQSYWQAAEMSWRLHNSDLMTSSPPNFTTGGFYQSNFDEFEEEYYTQGNGEHLNHLFLTPVYKPSPQVLNLMTNNYI